MYKSDPYTTQIHIQKGFSPLANHPVIAFPEGTQIFPKSMYTFSTNIKFMIAFLEALI